MIDVLSGFIPIMIVGLSLGSLFGLIGLGFTVIINSTQLVNFAQADFAVVGVFACWFALNFLKLPLSFGIIFAVLSGILIGILTERAIVTPLLRKGTGGVFAPILGTMSVGMIAAGAIGVFTDFFWMGIPHFISTEPWKVGNIYIESQGALIIVVTVLLVILYWLMLNRTFIGTALRASGYNRETSILLGIQPSKMVGLSFIISGAISGIAGVLCAPLAAFNAFDGLPLAIGGFVALILGGWGNPYAAVLGGITLGLIRALLTGYFSSAHAELASFIILILVLTLKPEGLFPQFMIPKETRRLSG